jgi:superfamily I DNA/RNA helicase
MSNQVNNFTDQDSFINQNSADQKKETGNQKQSRSLFVVGDDAQSIYGFRGSKIEIILNFEQEYPGTKEIILNQNYRSTQTILDLAEKVLSHNPTQKKKNLFTQNPEEVSISYYLARNERDEAEYIIRQLHNLYSKNSREIKTEDNEIYFEPSEFFSEAENLLNKNQEKFTEQIKPKTNDLISSMFDVYLEKDDDFMSSSLQNYEPNSWQVPSYDWSNLPKLNECAILYRTHGQSRSLEEAFLKYKVPYRLVSGVKFLDRKEIKDVLAILKFLANGEDKLSLNRFLPLLLDGVGPKTIQKIFAYMEDYDYPLPPKNQKQLMDLLQKMQASWQYSDNLIDLTKELLASSGYFRYLKGAYPKKEDLNTRLDNIGEIYSLMRPFDEDKNLELPARLQKFLEQVSLMSNSESEEENQNQPKINLMTLHQSKGLEFETVFLVGVEDGLLPHQNSFYDIDGFEEEVRISYVGVTRAKKNLHLVSAESRVQYGQIVAHPVSRIFRPFLDSHCIRSRGF